MMQQQIWVRILIFPVVIYVSLAGILFFSQGQMLFPRGVGGGELTATPADIGLNFATASIATADGETLDAWFVPARSARGTLLFFHGNAGNISHRLDSIFIFHQLGLNVLIFDYRGYGRSTGTPSEQGIYRDAEAAWRYLVEVRQLAPESIVLFGRSLGGAVAAWLAGEVNPAALIMESSFTSVPDLGSEIYPWLPVRLLARHVFDAIGRIRLVSAPVLVIHSSQDEIIPVHHGRALFGAANEPRYFLEIAGGHNGGFMQDLERYQKGIRIFVDGVFGGR